MPVDPEERLLGDRVLERFGVFDLPGRIQDLDADEFSEFIIIENCRC